MIDRYTKSAIRGAARTELLRGVLWLAVTVAVAVLAYVAEGFQGRTAVIWGVLALGAYRLVRGIYYYLNPDALLNR